MVKKIAHLFIDVAPQSDTSADLLKLSRYYLAHKCTQESSPVSDGSQRDLMVQQQKQHTKRQEKGKDTHMSERWLAIIICYSQNLQVKYSPQAPITEYWVLIKDVTGPKWVTLRRTTILRKVASLSKWSSHYISEEDAKFVDLLPRSGCLPGRWLFSNESRGVWRCLFGRVTFFIQFQW